MYYAQLDREEIETALATLTDSTNEVYDTIDLLKFSHVDNTRVSFIIDQRGLVSDCDSMVSVHFYLHPTLGRINISSSAEYANPKYNFLKWLKQNTHAYLSRQTETGLRLQQLDDTNRTLTAKGVDVSEYISSESGEYDVFIKFPVDIYIKTEPYSPSGEPPFNSDYVLVTMTSKLFNYENENDWFKWSKNKLIGVYQANLINDKLHSLSGHKPDNKLGVLAYIEKAKARGENFGICDYDTTRLIAFLFYGYYSNLNSQKICGSGTDNTIDNTSGTGPEYYVYPKVNGLTDSLGMKDTNPATGNGSAVDKDQVRAGTGSNIKAVNFWGFENCWGDLSETISNVHVMDASRPANVTTADPSSYITDYLDVNEKIIVNKLNEDGDTIYTSKEEFLADYSNQNDRFAAITDKNDNLIRVVDVNVPSAQGGYQHEAFITKMKFGNHADIFAKGGDWSYGTKYFADYFMFFAPKRQACRSFYSNREHCGVGFLCAEGGIGKTGWQTYGTRLIYEGDENSIHIIDDDTETL